MSTCQTEQLTNMIETLRDLLSDMHYESEDLDKYIHKRGYCPYCYLYHKNCIGCKCTKCGTYENNCECASDDDNADNESDINTSKSENATINNTNISESKNNEDISKSVVEETTKHSQLTQNENVTINNTNISETKNNEDISKSIVEETTEHPQLTPNKNVISDQSVPIADRQFSQELVYVWYELVLNPISGNAEQISTIDKMFISPEEAQQFYMSEKVDRYKDGHYFKSFRKGGKLEWYNPLKDETKWITPDYCGQWPYGHGLHRLYSKELPIEDNNVNDSIN